MTSRSVAGGTGPQVNLNLRDLAFDLTVAPALRVLAGTAMVLLFLAENTAMGACRIEASIRLGACS